jgi:pilus assembly protein CpaD
MTRNIIRLTAPLSLALTLSACVTQGQEFNRGIEPIKQPVVTYSSYVFDVSLNGKGEVSAPERVRLEGWLQSIDVGFGDHIAIATESGYYNHTARAGIAAVVEKHGLLVEEDASAQAGRAPDGALRVIVRRAKASVPGCPDWSVKEESTLMSAASSNYGCAINGNLASMVANPADLVRGQTADSDMEAVTASKAIKAYRDKAPGGAGGGN